MLQTRWKFSLPTFSLERKRSDFDFEDGLFNGGRLADLDSGAVGVRGITKQEVAGVEYNATIGVALQG